MPIKSNLDKHTIQWLKSQDDKGLLNKNISIQRKEVWDSEKKSNLIVSILLDIPIESLLFEETKTETLNVLDGKQRTLTLCSYLANGFALSPKIRIKRIGSTELVGYKFSDLPKVLQTKITEYELSISVLRPLDTEERATVFFMRNQAVSLSKMDLSLVMIGEEAMNKLDELCNHDFMMKIVKLTEPARRKHTDLQVILQYMLLLLRPDSGFSGAEIMSFCDDIKNGEAILPYEETLSVLEYLTDALPVRRQYLKKVHIPMVLYVARDAMLDGLDPFTFALRIDEFFEEINGNTEYTSTYGSGTAKRANVQARVRVLGEALRGKAKKSK